MNNQTFQRIINSWVQESEIGQVWLEQGDGITGKELCVGEDKVKQVGSIQSGVKEFCVFEIWPIFCVIEMFAFSYFRRVKVLYWVKKNTSLKMLVVASTSVLWKPIYHPGCYTKLNILK